MHLTVKVTPNAKKTEPVGWIDDENGDPVLRLKLSAPPVDGKANKALVAFLAKLAGVPKGAVAIVRGEKNRTKTVEIAGIGETELRSRIDSVLG